MRSIAAVLMLTFLAGVVYAGPVNPRLCIDTDTEVKALMQAAFLKKKVPVVLVDTCDGLTITLHVSRPIQSQSTFNMLMFGVRLDATATNPDGVVIYAKTMSKGTAQDAAQALAGNFQKFLATGKQ